MANKNTKLIIGLTGNIATGKSVVRKKLEKLGAYGIDADILAHRALEKNSPVYQHIIDKFGKEILGHNLEIDRKKLGNIVFSNPEYLKKLESIMHPIIRKAVNFLIEKSKKDVVVIEAIKLLESPIKDIVDFIWVTTSSQDNQLKRLLEDRGLPNDQAINIMNSQSSQDEKVKVASSIIINEGSVDEVWNQVEKYWNELVLEKTYLNKKTDSSVLNSFSIVRATPSYSDQIIEFIDEIENKLKDQAKININHFFGDLAYLLIMSENVIIGVVGWQVENLVTKVEKAWLRDGIDYSIGILDVVKEIEKASKELQAEVILILLREDVAKKFLLLKDFGYSVKKINSLHTQTWVNAAKSSINGNPEVLYKQLMQTII